MIKFILKDGAKLPKRGSKQAAGVDICTNVMVTLSPKEQVLVRTDVFLADCPEGMYLRVAPRSKLAVRYGLDVMAGVVDSDYRGEIRVLLNNTGNEIISFRRGDAIAQLIPERIFLCDVEEAFEGVDTKRGTSGINDKDLRLNTDNINLCTTCICDIPTCTGEPVFGTGKGNDNVIKCSKFIKSLL